ncbi:MAG: alanine--tRNA ligase-related protein [Candidatus Kuenenbacteria bacterium]
MFANEIREKFLNFFKKKGHKIIPSSSLIPKNDSTLLFVNSGMSPLVPYLLGEKHLEGNRLTNSQKCFRAEDIDEIGDGRHNTFFEMLGNWSLNDYFKKEQLNWWFEFLIEELKLNPKKIYQTVYFGDKNKQIEKDIETIKILKEIYSKYKIEALEGSETKGDGKLGPEMEIDFLKYKIFTYQDKNWWQRGESIGELGGPDSETFYDTGKKHDLKFGKFCHLNCDCGRFIEIGNSVFIQYQKKEKGWQQIKNKNVDFGGGLERITMIIQKKDNAFETDLFENLIKKLEQLSGIKYQEAPKPFEIIADHLKAATFIMGDERGIEPSNIGQGYVVRRLLRRAIRYGGQIGIQEKLWIKLIAKIVVDDYVKIYPELKRNFDFIINNLEKEEIKFSKTLKNGLAQFEKMLKLKINLSLNEKKIKGEEAFDLFQTYGFPLELTEELAKEKGFEINKKEFYEAQKKHQEISRAGAEKKFGGHGIEKSKITPLNSCKANLTGQENQKSKLSSYTGSRAAGQFKNQNLQLTTYNLQLTKLHTVTHLLHQALREILGNTVQQQGSNITDERLRFDFSHSQKMTDDEIKKVENLINQKIKENLEIKKEEMNLEDALKSNALAFFREKYPEKVTVYTILNSQTNEIFSKEICAGPHVNNINELGNFKIIKEESCGAGIRRIKAILENRF